MSVPSVRFAQADDVNIAYQVVGEGAVDLVWAYGLATNIEVFWEEPSLAAMLRRLSETSRLILFDRRGCGASDRGGTTVTPTLEERMEDVLAVLDAVGSERASVFGVSEGGVLAALLAAAHPERIASIILHGTIARHRRDADHPWGWASDDELTAFVELVSSGWGLGSDQAVALWAPSMSGDERFREWLGKYARQAVSRDAIRPLLWSLLDYDSMEIFPAVRVPALVLHRRGDALVPVEQSRHIARQIPQARLVELEGNDHLPFIGDTDAIVAEVEDFLTAGRSPLRRRRLLTVAALRIADAPEVAANVGDDAWRELVASHDRIVRSHLDRFGGQEVTHLGGVLAAFDGPARAIRCVLGIVDGAERLGLGVRAGLHVGECELHDHGVGGLTVELAARISELAVAGEIMVSNTVRELVAGSGVRFGDAAAVQPDHLGGAAGPRAVYPVLRHGETPDAVRRLAAEQTNVVRREGEYWTLAYEGYVVSLRDRKGVRDIARLLASPGREIHVLELAAEGGAAGRRVDAARVAAAGLTVGAEPADPVIDETARRSYERRLTELRQDLDDADARGDMEASAAARVEMDALVDQLTAAYGLGGRARRTPDHAERARKAVTRRVRDAVRIIQRLHPPLGRHLDASIRTGAFCSYAPERAVRWTVDAGGTPP